MFVITCNTCLFYSVPADGAGKICEQSPLAGFTGFIVVIFSSDDFRSHKTIKTINVM